MNILAIDPGTTQSAWAIYNGDCEEEPGNIIDFGIHTNHDLLDMIMDEELPIQADQLYVEMVASYGMPVGREVFETCVWIGRFIQAWTEDSQYPWVYVYRKDVKMHLCYDNRAKDSNIRQAIIDRYGGNKAKAVGTKKEPGPLYGVKKDIWAALAVAITAWETYHI